MKLTELRERMGLALKELSELQQKDERSETDESRIDALLLEVNDLGPKIERETTIAKTAERSDDYNAPATRADVLARRDARDDGKRAERIESLGRQFATSPELIQYRRAAGGKSAPFAAGSTHFIDSRDSDAPEQRTLVYTGATANLVNGQRLPDTYRPLVQPFQVGIRDVLINARTESNAVEYVQELAYTNAAVETAEAVSLVTGAKPESALTFQVTTANVKTIAHWIPITRQVMQDASQMEMYVNNRLIEGLRLRENTELVAGDGTGANLTGLYATSGIGNLDATYFTGNPLPAVGAAANNLDRIRRAKKYILVTGLAQPNFVVMHPDDAEKFDELKDSTGKYLVSDPIDYNPVRRLWGLTIVENVGATVGTPLVGDGTMAAVFDRMDATVFVADQHSDFFIRNIFVLLAESRLALAVFRPSAFAKVLLV